MTTPLLRPPARGHTESEQPVGCDFVCPDLAVRAWLERWLDSLDLPWPGQFRLIVSISEENPFPADDREVFRQPTVGIQAGSPTGSVRVTWEVAAAAAEVHATRPEAHLWLSHEAAAQLDRAERTFLMVTLIFMLRRLGWFHLHGAALPDPQGRGWLFVGNSNSGKSTTTALLATRGWQVGTDDIGFLAPSDDGIALIGALAQIALRDGGRDLLGARGGVAIAQRQKTGFWEEELGSTRAQVVVPQIIAFARVGERTGVVPAIPRIALSAMLNSSPWMLYEPSFAQEHLDVISQVSRQSRCYDLTLGPDLFDRPDLLEELVP